MKIALDLESVCAAIWTPALKDSEFLDESHKHKWHFEGGGLEKFMQCTDRIWGEEPERVPLVEQCVPYVAKQLHSDHTLDIVTNRAGHDDNLQWWLDEQGIPYRQFISNPTGTDKTEYGYDVYIDDSPDILGNGARVMLRDQPWNRGIETGDNVTRIKSLKEIDL